MLPPIATDVPSASIPNSVKEVGAGGHSLHAHGNSGNDSVTVSSGTRPQGYSLEAMPGLVLQEISRNLLRTSPTSVLFLRMMCKSLRNDQAIKSAAFALQCRFVNQRCDKRIMMEGVTRKFIDQQFKRCTNLDPALREQHLVELLKIIRAQTPDVQETYHGLTWNLAKKLKGRARSNVLQGLIESVVYLPRGSRVAWFERYKEVLLDPNIVHRDLLYASLAQTMNRLGQHVVREFFEPILNDIDKLRQEDLTYALWHLLSSRPLLPDNVINATFDKFLERVNSQKNEQTIRILFGLLRFPNILSEDQLALIRIKCSNAIGTIRDPKLLYLYSRIREQLIANLPEEQKTAAFLENLNFVKTATIPANAPTSAEIKQWKYDICAPLVLSFSTVPPSEHLVRGLITLAENFSVPTENGLLAETFADQFRAEDATFSEVFKRLLLHCSKADQSLAERNLFDS